LEADHPAAGPGGDTGETATEEEYQAVRAAMKRLAWKGQYVGIWLKDFFGVEKITQLTQQQAATAMTLLTAVTPGKKPAECPAYVSLAAAFRAKGQIS
jgi:hypothetical protein